MPEHRGIWTPADRVEAPYRYLPIDVSAGCAGLTVELEYDNSAGVLDLGCFGAAGFRGWSGGARSRFAIGSSAATPGYLPGELEAGEWSVALRLHRVPPDGLPWRVRVTLGSPEVETLPPVADTAVRRPARELPAPPGMRWLGGDLHAHTWHSDGASGPDELATLAAGAGLDFLAVTDHNTVSHHPLLAGAGARAGITLLPGQELTTDRGHGNAFGDIGWIDFRAPAQEWVDEVARRGGLLSINHPLAGDCSWRQPLDRRPGLAEIWHWSWLDRRWGGPMAWWQAWDPEVTPVGGSDFHRLDQGRLPGTPTTWVLSEDASVEAILAALAAGRTSVSAGRDGPVLLRIEDELLAVDADGAVLADAGGRRRIVHGSPARFTGGPGPQWLEDGDTEVLALTG